MMSFKERAKRHQIKFRKEVLGAGYDGYETILNDTDAQKGLIFFDGFRILEAAQARYPHFRLNQACFANLLRSEHIPFNFFIPLSKNLEYGRWVLNRFMGGVVNIITEIRIDYAPCPAQTLLDKTSFDVFIEYRHSSGGYGIIGIEVKYAESAYRMTKASREDREINNPESGYNSLSQKFGIYRDDIIENLKNDEYRQIWTNQLLGEGLTRKNNPDSKFEHFTSVILYPQGNEHFRELIPRYKSFLTPGNENCFIGITYEDFIAGAVMLTDDEGYLTWLQYLKNRYIVS
jgi:hypothetical protein